MKLMIVDDDYQIREGMKIGVEWTKFGIGEIFTCANGIEALDMFKEKTPDIILADIQMPGMTGLEMMKKIRAVNKEVCVIFISAYSDFEYCRQALQLGADDYVLKPIQFSKLEKTICKNVEKIKKRHSQSAIYKNALLEKEVRFIYEQGKEGGENLSKLLEEDYIFIKEKWFLTIILCLDKKRELSDMEYEEFVRSMENIVFLDKTAVFLPWKRDVFLILAKGSSSVLLSMYQQVEIRNRINSWNAMNKEKFGSISGGISGTHNINCLIKGYREAYEAWKYGFYQGDGCVTIFREDILCKQWDFENLLLEYFEKSLKNDVFSKLQEELILCEEKLKKERVDPVILKKKMKSILEKICRNERIIDIPDILSENRIEEAATLSEFMHLIEEFLYYVWEKKHFHIISKKYSHTVKLILEYVEKNYNELMNLTWIAEMVGKSPNYVGAIFKKEVGVSFAEYLTVFRMNKAKKLLIHTNKKVKEICEEVGYTDYAYFSYMFKQIYGCSASQFRKNLED